MTDIVLDAGREIDGFRLEEKLHQGGMATLWRVSRAGEGANAMPLIMKIPRIKGGEDPATIVGFEVEQMIMPTLSGTHVPHFVAKGGFSRQPYIVMEHIPGPTLRPRLEAAPIPLDEVARIGAAVATALHALHHQHVVHLDVKPSNVLFRAGGDAVLIDFGLSHHDHLPDLLEEEFSLPTDPKMIGTGPYMSPEQVQFVRNDPRSDLFALGVMLYHLATGERPVRPAADDARPAPPALRGSQAAARDPRRDRALAAGSDPEVPRGARRGSLPERGPARLRPAQSRAGGAHRARRPPRRSGALTRWRRWFQAIGHEPEPVTASTESPLERCPIVLAAVDVDHAAPNCSSGCARRCAASSPPSPVPALACLSVMKTVRIGVDELVDARGRSRHVKQLVALEHWARPISKALQLGQGGSPATCWKPPTGRARSSSSRRATRPTTSSWARAGASAMRRYLGSVSSQVWPNRAAPSPSCGRRARTTPRRRPRRSSSD
jgi:protein-serine/threonine kinase